MGESRKKEEYFCFAEHYCACYSFFYDIVNRGEQLCVSLHFFLFTILAIAVSDTIYHMITSLFFVTYLFIYISINIFLLSLFPCKCKHQLAARLAACLGACVEVKVSDEQLALLLSKL